MYSMIIVDDEVIEQKVLQKMVQDFCPNVRLLPSVSNGAELIACLEKNRPDLIVLDINMPVLNGLEVLEWIKLKGISVKILIVSAYSKFQYAQQCVNMGADGYILKPVNEQKFVELVHKLCSDLDREAEATAQRSSLETLKAEYKKTLENEIVSDLLLGEVNTDSIKKYLQFLRRPFCGGGTCVIKGSKGGLEEIQTEKILTELNRFCTCFWKQYKNFCAVCLLPDSEEQREQYEVWIEELFGYVKKKVSDCSWENLIIGVSGWKDSFEGLLEAIQESRVVVQGVSTPGFYFYRSPKKAQKEVSFHRDFYECCTLVRRGASEEIQKGLWLLWNRVLKEGGEVSTIRLAALALLCVMDQEDGENGIFSKGYTHLDEWNELLIFNTPEELSRCVANKKEKITGGKKAPHQENQTYVEQCVRYLECHYTEAVSLETAADKIGISSFYLSRLFKQERKKTFVEVLTDIRLAAALDLMWKSNEGFQRITEQVGYDNVSYFYKLFKKRMVLTASEVRAEIKKFL